MDEEEVGHTQKPSRVAGGRVAESGQVWSAAGNRTSTEIISRYHIPVAGACAEPGQIRVVSWEGTTSDTLSTLRVTVAPTTPWTSPQTHGIHALQPLGTGRPSSQYSSCYLFACLTATICSGPTSPEVPRTTGALHNHSVSTLGTALQR